MVDEQIKGIISEQFDIDEEELTMETSFRDDLNADSLDLVELIMALEDEFDLEVGDEDITRIDTIGDAVNYIDDILQD
ncbi:MAG: acyl carrier protein [Tissierellia bacterium]|nr:acyl carrier protein [Tissierellia bacterium]